MACAPSISNIELPSSLVPGGHVSDDELGVSTSTTTTARLELALNDSDPETSYSVIRPRELKNIMDIAIANQDAVLQESPDIRGQGGSPPESPSPAPRSTRVWMSPTPSEDPVNAMPPVLSTATSGFSGSRSLALALGCFGMIPPLIYLVKAIPTPQLWLVTLSMSIALGGFLFYFKHAVLLGTKAIVKMSTQIGKSISKLVCRILRRWLEYLDIISSAAVSLVYAVDTITVQYLALFTVFLSVTLGGYLVSWKHSLRVSKERKAKRVQIDHTIEVIGDAADKAPEGCEEILAMSTGASDDTIAEIIPVDCPKLPQEDVENIFEHTNLGLDSVVSSTPRKPKLNPFAPAFTPVFCDPLNAVGNIIPDPVRFPKAIPIMPPRRRIRTRTRTRSSAPAEQ